jgi:hypothetical protein
MTQRTIKFRAWDGKAMRPIAGLSWRKIFSGGEPEYFPTEQIRDVDYGDSDKRNWQHPYEPNCPREEDKWKAHFEELEKMEDQWLEAMSALPIMQFTGYHDKNNREIYEGDFVASSAFKTAVVEWDAKGGVWKCGGWHLAVYLEHKPEIVGNIYETPELLQ